MKKLLVIAGMIVIALAVWFGVRLLQQSPPADGPAPSNRPVPNVARTSRGGRSDATSFPSESGQFPVDRSAPTRTGNGEAVPTGGPAPTNVEASQGKYRDRVVVTWSAMEDVDRYKVTRCPASSSSKPVDVGWVEPGPSPSYEDRTAGDGEYEYRVSAAQEGSWSRPSAPAVGWRGKLDAPAVIFATDRTYADKVHVVWEAVNGAVAYELFRIQLQATGPGPSIGGVDEAQDKLLEFADQTQDMVVYPCRELQFSDTAVTTNVFYAYRVRAVDSAGGYSAFSKWDRGSARPISKTLTAPAWIRASSDNPGFISVEWEHDPSLPYWEIGYEIWRSDQPEVFWAKVVEPGARGGMRVDRNVVPGVTYYYWVRSGDGGTSLSAFSPAATGVATKRPGRR